MVKFLINKLNVIISNDKIIWDVKIYLFWNLSLKYLISVGRKI